MSAPPLACAKYVPPHLRARQQQQQQQQLNRGDGCRCSLVPGIFPGSSHAVRQAEASTGLLGGLQQFCAAFYHIEPTPEAGLEELCLQAVHGRTAPTCTRKTVVCIARLQRSDGSGGWLDRYTCRYVNCWRGDSTTNVHSERFMIQDAELEGAVRSLGSGSGRLVLYLTYQPW